MSNLKGFLIGFKGGVGGVCLVYFVNKVFKKICIKLKGFPLGFKEDLFGLLIKKVCKIFMSKFKGFPLGFKANLFSLFIEKVFENSLCVNKCQSPMQT
jgi:riboflavin transporter FmnP